MTVVRFNEAGTTSDFLGLLKRLNAEFGLQIKTDEQFIPSETAATPEKRCSKFAHYHYTKNREHLDKCIERFRSLDRHAQTSQTLSEILKPSPASAAESFTSPLQLTGSATTSFSSNASTVFERSPNSAATSLTDISTCSRLGSDLPLFVSVFARPDPHNALIATFHGRSADLPSGRPLRENYRLQRLPVAGFSCSDLPSQHHDLPLPVRYLFQSFACHHVLVMPDLNPLAKQSAPWQDLDWLFEKVMALVPPNHKQPAGPLGKPSRKTWEAVMSTSSFPKGLTMSAVLQPQSAPASSAFKFVLNPLTINDKSNRFARKFGPHRFLKLLIPTSSDVCAVAEHLKVNGRGDALEERLQQWLNVQGKSLLGCKWSALHNKPAKATEKQRRKYGHDGRREVIFFATSGAGLETISRSQVLNWFLPMRLNVKMPSCKAFARLELGFSTTQPTIVFNPSQIIEVDDILGDCTPEDATLNDASFDWTGVFYPPEPRVMNDGCSTISYAAAKLIWEKYLGNTGRVPSAFQARIGPWKGIWSVEKPSRSLETEDVDVWIKVCPSQKKFNRHIEDLGHQYDPERLTFEVLTWSRGLSKSKLYIDQLPILENRGVKRAVFKDVVLAELAVEEAKAEEAWLDSVSLLDWVQRTWGLSSDNPDGTDWSGPCKKSKQEMMRTMLNSGFEITENAFLRDLTKISMTWRFLDLGESLDIPLAKSTMAIGIADPSGTLGPNEIHLGFSDSELADDPNLCGCDALVSRHPSLRASDVQRVHTVFKPDLMHLRDVVVFSTKGAFPLAAKLQGGDYDGDTFWICWDARLVENFRNAPPPAESLLPEDFDIHVDRTTCERLPHSEAEIDEFFSRSFRFQWQASFLGVCTRQYEYLRYALGSTRMNDYRLKRLVDIHDLIIDSSKNGYTLTQQSWAKQTAGFPEMRKPLYKEPEKYKGGITSFESIVDFLIFAVARPRCNKFLEDLSKSHQHNRVTTRDDAVTQVFQDAICGTTEEVVEELKLLEEQIKSPPKNLRQIVGLATGASNESKYQTSTRHDAVSKRDSKYSWTEVESAHVTWYNGLKPAPSSDPAVRQVWQTRLGREAPSHWDYLKASALFAFWPGKHSLMYTMAGREICELKSHSWKRSESIIPKIKDCWKFKKRRRGVPSHNAGREFDYSFAESNYFSGDDDGVGNAPNSTTRARKRSRYSKAPVHMQSPSAKANQRTLNTPETGGTPTDVDTESDTDPATDPETSYESAVEDVFESVSEEVQYLSQEYSQLDIDDDVDDIDEDKTLHPKSHNNGISGALV